MGRRTAGILVTVILSTALLVPAAASASDATKTPDACSLITSEATGALPEPYTVERTDPLSKTNCLYYLQGTGSNEGTSDPINLFLEPKSDYSLSKALAQKVKKVKGLGTAAYKGIVGGDPVVGFIGKSKAVRLTGGLDPATLIVLAKGFAKQV